LAAADPPDRAAVTCAVDGSGSTPDQPDHKGLRRPSQADASLKKSRISVQSVNKGVALLAGTAKTLSAHLRAVETVAWVPGVWPRLCSTP
jgi:hypothetical protein